MNLPLDCHEPGYQPNESLHTLSITDPHILQKRQLSFSDHLISKTAIDQSKV